MASVLPHMSIEDVGDKKVSLVLAGVGRGDRYARSNKNIPVWKYPILARNYSMKYELCARIKRNLSKRKA
jgi:hypothetical protein